MRGRAPALSRSLRLRAARPLCDISTPTEKSGDGREEEEEKRNDFLPPFLAERVPESSFPSLEKKNIKKKNLPFAA